MLSIKAYQHYKKSHIEWLGDVPAHWLVDRAKWSVLNIQNGVWGSEPEGDNDLVCIRVADFDRKSLTVSLNNLTLRNILPKDRNTRLLKEGDLLLEKSGGGDKQLVGAVVRFNHNFSAVTSNFVAKMSVHHTCNGRFLTYVHSHLYDSFINYRSIKQTTGIQNLDSQQYLDERIPYPPLEEQQKIADFLDYKTAQIDALIAKKEALLSKLQEKRSALITQAVTKGIHPNVAMKPSGVEWLGEVPAHWDIKRLKFTVNHIGEKIEAEFSELAYMGLEHIESWTGKRIEDESASSEGTASKFIKDDVLFGKLRPYLAKVYLANHEGLVSTEALVLRSLPSVFPNFLRYYLVSKDFINIVNSSTFGSKMPRANWDFIANLPMLLPSIEEQNEIANYLDDKLNILEKQKQKVSDVIAALNEYRAALITNAVTGKIDVRDFQIPK